MQLHAPSASEPLADGGRKAGNSAFSTGFDWFINTPGNRHIRCNEIV
ncbi:hypothetical protein B23_0730 [Geobacillus thermoleovorans B23]|nr:hypothetical protein B23_0730 [Geobacillus thermoleovorans B23]